MIAFSEAKRSPTGSSSPTRGATTSRRHPVRSRLSRRRIGRASKRRGVAAVEFAIIAPIFFLVVLGIIEFGRMVMVQQVLTNASREGARRAVIEGSTDSEVKSLVQTYLSNATIEGATVTVSPSDLENIGFGDPVTVTAAIPFDDVSWVGTPWFLGGTTLQARAVMQGERLQ